ncbi:hypothetical protein RM519_13890, partial [Urechidicola sp. P050]|nr:hypothetical protein [Urechidicola sp. P050]
MKKIILFKLVLAFTLLSTNVFSQIDLRSECGGDFGCTSNNYTITDIYLIDAEEYLSDGITPNPNYGLELSQAYQTCTIGVTRRVSIGMDYTSNNNKNNYAARFFADFTVDGLPYQGAPDAFVNPYIGTLTPGAGSFNLLNTGYSFDWTCGQVLELSNMLVAWSTNDPGDLSDPPGGAGYDCSTYNKAQCQFGSGSAIIHAPLAVEYQYSVCTIGNIATVNFTDLTTGGELPYQYSWDLDGGSIVPGSVLTDPNPVATFDISQGPYSPTLQVTDVNNVVSTYSLQLTFPSELVLSYSSINASCLGTGGSANFVASGGIAPYTFTVDTNTTGGIRNNLSPTEIEFNPAGTGTITVTVTDATGCSSQQSVLISNETDNAPIITGAINDTNVNGCDISVAPIAQTTVAGLEALVGNLLISDDNTPKTDLIVNSSDSNSSTCPIIITRTYTIEDVCGNVSLPFVHTIYIDTPDFTPAPNGSSTVECIAEAQIAPDLPDVNDACGNPITPTLKSSPNDIICEGEMIWVYTYTDCANNTHDWTYTYTIDVLTAPVVPANASSTVECIGLAIQPTAPVVTDVCGNGIIPVITENTDPVCEGDKIYTFTYTDCAGNVSVYTYTYTIDLLAFTLPANGFMTVTGIGDVVTPTP